MKKHNLSDVTFLIPVFPDSVEQMENILAVIGFLELHFETSVKVIEFAPFKTGLLSKILPSSVDYSFRKENMTGPRKYFLAEGMRGIETPYVVVWYAGFMVGKTQIINTVKCLRMGADLVYPYRGPFFNTSYLLRKLFLQNGNMDWLEQNTHLMKEISMTSSFKLLGAGLSVGKEVFSEQKSFHEQGDILERYSVKKIKGPLFYLDHHSMIRTKSSVNDRCCSGSGDWAENPACRDFLNADNGFVG